MFGLTWQGEKFLQLRNWLIHLINNKERKQFGLKRFLSADKDFKMVKIQKFVNGNQHVLKYVLLLNSFNYLKKLSLLPVPWLSSAVYLKIYRISINI